MIVEAELISAVCEILEKLGFADFVIRINHRQLLTKILSAANIPEKSHLDAVTALDKIDKIGREGVEKEFKTRGIVDESTNKLLTFLEFFIKDNTKEILNENQRINLTKFLKQVKDSDKITEKIISILEKDEDNNQRVQLAQRFRELENYFNHIFILTDIDKFIGNGEVIYTNETGELFNLVTLINSSKAKKYVKIDPTLARGLSYYTGAIFEINVPDLAGSIGGGGRYDGLIGMFGKEQIPACGFSLGLERILVVMEERGMFQKLIDEGKLKDDSADVMIACFDEKLIGESLKLAAELREKDLRVLVYPEASQKAKPMKYAEQIKVPFVCLLKQNENSEIQISLKNMQTGAQELVERAELSSKIKI